MATRFAKEPITLHRAECASHTKWLDVEAATLAQTAANVAHLGDSYVVKKRLAWATARDLVAIHRRDAIYFPCCYKGED